MVSITGVRIGSIGAGGISFDDGAAPQRAPDLKAGDVPVWLDPQGDSVQATIGPFGMSVTVGPGNMIGEMSSSVNGVSLSVSVDEHLLVVNGHAFDVRVEGGKATATPMQAKPRDLDAVDRGSRRSQSTIVGARIGTLGAGDVHVLGNVAAGLSALGRAAPAHLVAPSQDGAALAASLKSMSFDSKRLEAVQSYAGPVDAKDVPALLAAFSFDSSRGDALRALVGKVDGALDKDAVLATFSFRSGREDAQRALA